MRTAFLFAAALCVIVFAPWGTTTNNWVAGILTGVFVVLALISHIDNTIPHDSDDLEG